MTFGPMPGSCFVILRYFGLYGMRPSPFACQGMKQVHFPHIRKCHESVSRISGNATNPFSHIRKCHESVFRISGNAANPFSHIRKCSESVFRISGNAVNPFSQIPVCGIALSASLRMELNSLSELRPTLRTPMLVKSRFFGEKTNISPVLEADFPFLTYYAFWANRIKVATSLQQKQFPAFVRRTRTRWLIILSAPKLCW